jgi:hypothetical protein
MSIDAVRECVRRPGYQCDVGTVGSRDDALLFVESESCMDALDVCLNGRPETTSSGGSSGAACAGGGCDCTDDDPEPAQSSNDTCNDDCEKCNQNCSDCNDNCEQCNDNCRDCNQNQEDCEDNNCKSETKNGAVYSGPVACKMSAARRRKAGGRQQGVPIPFATAMWLLAPAAYMARRARRPS